MKKVRCVKQDIMGFLVVGMIYEVDQEFTYSYCVRVQSGSGSVSYSKNFFEDVQEVKMRLVRCINDEISPGRKATPLHLGAIYEFELAYSKTTLKLKNITGEWSISRFEDVAEDSILVRCKDVSGYEKTGEIILGAIYEVQTIGGATFFIKGASTTFLQNRFDVINRASFFNSSAVKAEPEKPKEISEWEIWANHGLLPGECKCGYGTLKVNCVYHR